MDGQDKSKINVRPSLVERRRRIGGPTTSALSLRLAGRIGAARRAAQSIGLSCQHQLGNAILRISRFPIRTRAGRPQTGAHCVRCVRVDSY